MSLCAGMRREQKSDLVFYMIDETPEIVRAKRGAASGQLFGGIGSLFCRTRCRPAARAMAASAAAPEKPAQDL